MRTRRIAALASPRPISSRKSETTRSLRVSGHLIQGSPFAAALPFDEAPFGDPHIERNMKKLSEEGVGREEAPRAAKSGGSNLKQSTDRPCVTL
jgi:hypothetical protein